MRYLLIFKFVLLSSILFAQTNHVYLDKSGNRTSNIKKADSYYTLERVSLDSVWLVKQYSIKDEILTAGHFKDSLLSIPHGQFIYYQRFSGKEVVKYDYKKDRSDTISAKNGNYIFRKGFFLEGKKVGRWIDYYTDGSPHILSTFKNDLLDGIHLEYLNNDGNVNIIGNYINNKREGLWYTLSAKGDTIGTDHYNNDINIEHRSLADKNKVINNPDKQDAKPDFDMINVITQALSKAKMGSIRNGKYSFILSKTGELTDPVIENVGDLKYDKLVLETLMTSPSWNPALYKNVRVDSKIGVMIVGASTSKPLAFVSCTFLE
ncbi:hypothetical protein GCM10028827_21770 [Mucilaginibacter myungsuensis]